MNRIEEIDKQVCDLKKEREIIKNIGYLERLGEYQLEGIFHQSDSCEFEIHMDNYKFHEVRKLLIELFKMEIGE